MTAQRRDRIDGPALFLQGTILVLAIQSLLLVAERSATSAAADRRAGRGGRRLARRAAGSRASDRVQTEIFPLLLFAVAGMLIFPRPNNLLLMFVALEVLSLPLYLMAGWPGGGGCSRRRRR